MVVIHEPIGKPSGSPAAEEPDGTESAGEGADVGDVPPGVVEHAATIAATIARAPTARLT
jgi:hypothetical protein